MPVRGGSELARCVEAYRSAYKSPALYLVAFSPFRDHPARHDRLASSRGSDLSQLVRERWERTRPAASRSENALQRPPTDELLPRRHPRSCVLSGRSAKALPAQCRATRKPAVELSSLRMLAEHDEALNYKREISESFGVFQTKGFFAVAYGPVLAFFSENTRLRRTDAWCRNAPPAEPD